MDKLLDLHPSIDLPHDLLKPNAPIALPHEILKPNAPIALPHEILVGSSRQPQDTSYIANHIHLDLLPKDQTSSSSYNPHAFVDFSLTDFSLAYSPSNNGWGIESSNEQPATYPTLVLIDLESEEEMLWEALTKIGLQETFCDQVVEDLRAKVAEVGLVDDFVIHAQVHILRVSLEDDVSEVIESPTFEVEDDCHVDEMSPELPDEEEEDFINYSDSSCVDDFLS